MFRVASIVSVLALSLFAVPASAMSARTAVVAQDDDGATDAPVHVTETKQVKPCIPIFIWIGHGKDAVKVWSGVCKAGTGPKS